MNLLENVGGAVPQGLRILMVAPQPFFEPRGTPFSVLHRIRALLSLGHTVELVTYPFGESPELEGLVIHRTARAPGIRSVRIGPSIAKLVLDIPLFLKTHALARSRPFDVLHTHEEAGFVGPMIARSAGIPHLLDMHSSLPQQLANFGRFNWAPVVRAFERLERHALAGADGLITICPDLDDHVRDLGYDGPRAMIENTLDFDPPPIDRLQLDALRDRLGARRRPLVVYTGTLEAYQGLDLLIQSAPLTLARVPDACFAVIGGTPYQIEPLQAMAREHGVAEAFRFVPAVPPLEVFAYLTAADALVTCRARGTNTPLKIYQYLRAGRPIVATRIHSHTQALDDDSAELVPPTAEGIADGLVRVLTDPGRAAACSAGALRLSTERFSEEEYLRRLADLLDRMGLGEPTLAAG
jgi:glycosyltransferase involved in cell wall biosynthesis